MVSHGTHDFCHTRALLTERLIKERGFSAVAVDFLDKVDPEAARRARYRYSCFEHFGEDTQAFGYAASYYRSMFESRVKSWNLRDQHMVETLNARRSRIATNPSFT